MPLIQPLRLDWDILAHGPIGLLGDRPAVVPLPHPGSLRAI